MALLPSTIYHDKYLQRASDRVASINFRKQIIKAQIVANYKNEYQRLRGELYANPHLPVPTRQHIEKRLKDLQELGKHIGDHDDWKNEKNE